jgi:hypothetical protein
MRKTTPLTKLTVLAVAPLALALACKPDLGDPPSVVSGPRILAVRGVPAEAAQDEPVVYDVLAVDETGTLVNPPVTWATCHEPKPPAEANAVSAACLDIDPETGFQATFKSPMPSTACKQFGPQPPDVERGKPPIRPRDPDTTGGFYQPVRAILDGGTIAFAMERIKCPLANAPSDITGMFNAMYKANVNPTLQSVTLDPDDDPVTLFEEGSAQGDDWVGSAGSFFVQAAWPDTTPESYPVWNPMTQTLDTHREALSVAWYATAGTFDHDRTGRGEAEPELTTTNRWTAPAVTEPTTVHLWVVLRDSRGGVDFAAMDLEVRP